MAAVERPCPLLVFDAKVEVKPEELKRQLEKGDVNQKIEAMKKV